MPPLIAIIGRTNVGKSALFNRLVGQRRAVVEDIPGVTRDRLYAEIDLGGRRAVLVDTGGLVGAESDALIGQVQQHAAQALAEADVLLLLFDGQEGLTSLDYEVAEAARRSRKPVVAAVNKTEFGRGEAAQFAELGFGVPLAISALHGQGLHELEEALRRALPPVEEEPEAPASAGAIGLAILGRPNVGKSALVNALLGQPRMIVSELPGTTRDAVDTRWEWQGTCFQLVDTPGLRRRGKRARGVEYYSSLRTLKALQRAQIGVMVFDANEGLTQQDAAIALEVHSAGRALLVVANKWDLVRAKAFGDSDLSPEEQKRAERLLKRDFEALARGRLKFAPHAPLQYTCALDGEGVEEILPLAKKMNEQYFRRIETGPLNRALDEALAEHAPPSRGGRQLRVYYATQAATGPPTFVLFVNDPKLMHFSFERYLVNFLRRKFGLTHVPLNLRVRESSGKG